MLIQIIFLLTLLVSCLLATPATTNPDSPLNHSLNRRAPITCFEDTTEEPIFAPIQEDCQQAIQNVLSCHEDINFMEMAFARGGTKVVGVSAQIPLRWTYNTCTIAVDIVEAVNVDVNVWNVYETTTLMEISTTAHEIRMWCRDSRFGGLTSVGQRGLLHVFVAGHGPDDFRDDEFSLPRPGIIN